MKVRSWPVMKENCPSCPFREDEHGRRADPRLAGTIEARCLTKASQICHHPRLSGKRETHLCRGARNFQLMIFYRLGLLSAPTDEAWAKAYGNLTTSRRHKRPADQATKKGRSRTASDE